MTLFLQRNSVLSGTPDRKAAEKQNLVTSGQLANPISQKTVLSGKPTRNIKPTNTSQVLVSETVPSRRVQPSRETKKTRFQDNPVSSTVPVPPRRQPGRDTSTRNRRKFRLDVSDPDLLLPLKQTRVNETDRHSDLREPQPSPTSKSSVSLPSSPSGSSCTTSTSTSGTDSSSSETSSESSSQPSSNASSPRDNNNISQFITINVTRTVRDGALFQQPAGWYKRETRTHSDEETDGRSERTTAMDHCLEASCHAATKPTEASLSTSSSKHATSPISPKTSV